jgi:PIN domain nuclease of toxin-antitoxin system
MLLDTRTAWWLVRKPEMLGKNLVRKFEKNKAAFFSPISVFELLQKNAKQNMGVPANLAEVFFASGLLELNLNSDHAGAAVNFSSSISDPFDRLLLAQAEVQQLDFYTSDSKILSLGIEIVKDASA